MTMTGILDPRQEIIQSVLEEMKQIKGRLTEIKAQLEQTQMVVDKEQQRNADIATELRIIQDNLDTVPRQDIRSKYDEAMDARFRVTTMRSQLEKFQAQREMLERQQTLLSQILNKLQGVDVLSGGDENGHDGPTPVRGGINVVRIVQAQEEERKRLANQMHDGPAQSLTNFILQTEICQRLFDRNPERAAEELGNLKSAASVTFQKVRDFIFDLSPMMLNDLGVVPTVRRYVESFKEKNDIDTRLDILGEERRLEQRYREVVIFRGIQELMGHARDYANATQLSIRLDMSSTRIKIYVTDNGESFDAEAVFATGSDSTAARVSDLITLKEKYELVGGTMAITSKENDGTEVRLELPETDI
jgi:two-component system, NarL family, sensor histidine kinase DegS